jgi:1-acyl-sn-glycerol-3-phosphate acyltransferase
MSGEVKGFPKKFPVRDDDRPPIRYQIAVTLSRLYLQLLARRRLRIEGEANIPAEGPLLVACNHTSNLDPMILGGFFPHTLFAMAKREMYFARPVAWFLAGINCIPVDRGAADRRALTLALEVLRRRGRLLIFVEGTRSRDGTMQRPEVGIAFLARRSGAPVLPVAICHSYDKGKGTAGRFRRSQIVLRYGPPFQVDLTDRRDHRMIADEIGERIAALLPAERRGVYPGTEEAS